MNLFKKTLLLSLFGLVTICAQPLSFASEDGEAVSWDAQFSNRIAAVVEGEVITLQQLRQQANPLIPQVRMESSSKREFEQRVNALYSEVLQNLVDQILIVKEFHEKGYTIPQTYIENEYDDYITKEFNGDRSEFLQFLKVQGKTPRQFREELTDRVIVGFMRGQMLKSPTEISPERIQEYYEKNKYQFIEEEAVLLRVIQLSPIANESPDLMRQTADRARQKLEAGTEFAAVAKEFSDHESRRSGGLWPWYTKSELTETLRDVAFGLEVGEYSEPIELANNIYILFAEDKREEGVKELDSVRREIENAIAARLAREYQQEWLEELRKDAYVKVYAQ